MTDKQPEALRLAELLDKRISMWDCEAAAELRRLHEANAELVEALKVARNWLVNDEGQIGWSIDRISAALAKAQGDNNANG